MVNLLKFLFRVLFVSFIFYDTLKKVCMCVDNRTAVAYLLKMGGNAIPFIARDSPGTVGLCIKQADNSDCRISA